LRERDGDTILLAKAFLNKFNEELGKSLRGFTKDAIEAIEKYRWPGNVREIESRIKRAAIMAEGQHITVTDLDLNFVDDEIQSAPATLQEARLRAESQVIRRALIQFDGNISLAAKELGVTRPTLYGLLEKYHLKAVSKE
jgi:two-component system NtrC family response regulator